jgi:AcrR family transcriptional regulator
MSPKPSENAPKPAAADARPVRRAHKPAEERQAEILRAAAEIFTERGYRSADVQQVADRVGVGKGTVYRQFPTKEALFLATVEDAMKRLTTEVDTAVNASLDPITQIRDAFRAFFGFFDRYPGTVELFIQERAEFRDRAKPIYFVYRELNRDRWMGLFKQLLGEGRLRVHSAEAVRDVLGDLAYGAIFTHRLGGNPRSLSERSDEIVDILLYGFATPDAEPEARSK